MGAEMSVSRYYSPLRYPGGKGRIANYVKLLLEQNLLLDGIYVEPYAGGASVAIDLLVNEYVSDIHINDIDYSIYSFWYSILNDTERLCEKIKNAQLTIEEWKKQRNIHRNTDEYPVLDVGFSAFYLNRVNRSGILTGGVIGGVEQNGKWKIDARFTKENLIKRIQIIADYKDRINLYNEDAVHLIKRLSKSLPKKTLYYLDPPYYDKGKELYVNYYKHEDHVDIANIVSKLRDKYWLVSYDNVAQIRRLYNKFRQHQYSLNYSAAKSKKGSEVLVFSDLLTIPEIENPTNRLEVKKYNYGAI
jgi:DNA adenine methylase